MASNSKLLTPANIKEILLPETAESIKAATNQKVILSGDTDLLRKKMLDPRRPLLLETRLDADDGLHRDALSDIQEVARALPVDTRGWQIICNNIHYEWRNDDIAAINSSPTGNMTSGTLRIVQESICVTPGYTLVRHRELPSIDFPAWPKIGHNLVAREWPQCQLEDGDVLEATGGRTKNRNATHDCWTKMPYYPSALRSRTVTSAGMSRVESKPGDALKFENRTKMFWKLVQRDFAIEPESAFTTSEYMKNNLGRIASDNLKGQCTSGHSCKNSSKAKLEEILAKTS